MRLTRAAEYAVRCVLYLAQQGDNAVVGKKEIAARMDVPVHFLSKIAQQLAKAGILQILQGAAGGYRLLLPPSDITLLMVVEAIIGKIFLNDCIMRPESCHASSACKVNRVWLKARDQLRQTLGEVSFADLLDDDSCCIVPLAKIENAYNKSHTGKP